MNKPQQLRLVIEDYLLEQGERPEKAKGAADCAVRVWAMKPAVYTHRVTLGHAKDDWSELASGERKKQWNRWMSRVRRYLRIAEKYGIVSSYRTYSGVLLWEYVWDDVYSAKAYSAKA